MSQLTTNHDIAAAVRAGDFDSFMAALAAGGESGFVDLEVAKQVLNGFPDADADPGDNISLAELCFKHNQPTMLRAATQATWPSEVNIGTWSNKVSNARDKLSILSTRFSRGQHTRISISHHAAFEPLPQSVDFVLIGLELQGDNHSLDQLSDTDPASAATIAAARMEHRIKLQLLSTAEPDVMATVASGAPEASPTSRRRPNL